MIDMGPMTTLAQHVRLRNLMESPLIHLVSEDPRIRRDALADRLSRVAMLMLDPSTDVRGTRLGPTICCPGRVQVVVLHRPDVHIDIRVFHEGTETTRLKAGAADGTRDDDEHAIDVPTTADAVAAFAMILRRMDPHGHMRTGLERAEEMTGTIAEWWETCREAGRVLKNAADVLSTVADHRMPVPVRLMSTTPFTRMQTVCMLDEEPQERVERTAAAWTNPPPCLLDVTVHYAERYDSIDVSAASVFGDGLNDLDLMRAMARLDGAGDSR